MPSGRRGSHGMAGVKQYLIPKRDRPSFDRFRAYGLSPTAPLLAPPTPSPDQPWHGRWASSPCISLRSAIPALWRSNISFRSNSANAANMVRNLPAGRRRSLVSFHSFRRWFITKAEHAGSAAAATGTTLGGSDSISTTLERWPTAATRKSLFSSSEIIQFPPILAPALGGLHSRLRSFTYRTA